MFRFLFLIFLVTACATTKEITNRSEIATEATPKEFAPGEIILAAELLTKIFDQEMAPLACVGDTDEASLLLRTIRPRIDMVVDDMEAKLDDPKEVANLINNCQKNCTCGYVDELFREHLVPLSKEQRKILTIKKSEKELNRCMNFIQSTFCQSELYKALDTEKVDFTFEEGP